MTIATQQRTRQNPLKSGLDREVAMRLAATEYARVVAVLGSLAPEQWDAPTACTEWDVRALAGHVLGMAQMAASMPEMMRQQVVAKRRAKRDGTPVIDALTSLQVDKNASLSREQVVDQLRVVGPRAVRARRRTPAFVRNRAADPQEVAGQQEWWTFGYLLDTILTRDPFMHRSDIAVATGAPMDTAAEHEGVIVDDVVREWGARHGQPYLLELTGPAGGRWRQGEGERITMDAIQFCRAVAGREPPTGLLCVQVPF